MKKQEKFGSKTTKKPSMFPLRRLLVICGIFLFCSICAVILFLSTGHIINPVWYYMVPIIFTIVVGPMFVALQWLFPFSPSERRNSSSQSLSVENSKLDLLEYPLQQTQIKPFPIEDLREKEQALKVTRSFFSLRDESFPEYCKCKSAWDDKLHRYAVSDGLSATFLSNKWAEVLVNTFVKYQGNIALKEDFIVWLSKCSDDWRTWLKQYFIPTKNRRLREKHNWDLEISMGAQATFVGFSLDPNQDLPISEQNSQVEIHAFAVGDACFFLFHPSSQLNGKLDRFNSFPYDSSDQFSVKPYTIGTQSDRFIGSWQHLKISKCIGRPGDYIVLANDSLASWIFSNVVEKNRFPLDLLSISSQKEFQDFINQERQDKRIAFDDVVMLVVPL